MSNVRKYMEEIMIKKYTGMFTDEFIQNHSSFESFEQLWSNHKSRLKSELPFLKYIRTKEWDEYIKENTEFEDFVGMEFAAKINDFKTKGKYWFSDD